MSELRDKNGLTEEEYLAAYNPGDWERPALTADVVFFSRAAGRLQVLLIRRGGHPYLGFWAFPGGFAEKGEELIGSAARELREETGLSMADLRLIGVYSAPGRDPRGWTVSAAYLALADEDRPRQKAGDDAERAEWFDLEKTADGFFLSRNGLALEKKRGRILAFDHDRILRDALAMLEE